MPRVTYIEHDGSARTVEVAAGENVMRGALYAGVPGIAGECGGALSCATCRCFVDEAWTARVGPPASHEERELLEAAEMLDEGEPAGRHVRLSCQIVMDAGLDGLVVRLPEHQFA
jgi:2Fe-2S ferredoxin